MCDPVQRCSGAIDSPRGRPGWRDLTAGLLSALIVHGLMLTSGLVGFAADWPQFLGPERNGQSAETGFDWDWSRSRPRAVWKVEIGTGFSSPIVVGDRVFTLVSRKQRDFAIALDKRDGREVWAVELGPTFLDRQRQGPGPRATPTWVDGRLICLLPLGDLLSLDAATGDLIWRVNVLGLGRIRTRKDETLYWGHSASPLVMGEQILVQPGDDHGHSVMSIHLADGKLLWSLGRDPMGYGSPTMIELEGRAVAVIVTGQSLLLIDPERDAARVQAEKAERAERSATAGKIKDPTGIRRPGKRLVTDDSAEGDENPRSGGAATAKGKPDGSRDNVDSLQDSRLLWRVPIGNQYDCNCATPVWHQGELIMSAAYGTGSLLLNFDQWADSRQPIVRWKSKQLQSQFATPIPLGDSLYGCHGDLGIATFRCISLKTGRLQWQARGPGKCTMVAAEGHAICLSEEGDLTVVQLDPERYIERGRMEQVLQPRAWAPPALADGRLYIRDQRHLVCLELQRR